MAKKKKKVEEEPEVVANCDQSKDVVANCDQLSVEVVRYDLTNVDIESLIRTIRGHKVMVDFDLGMLYGVKTKALNQSVKPNIKRCYQ